MLLLKLILTGALLFVLAFLTMGGYQLWLEHHVPSPTTQSSAIIVLGAQVTPDGNPSVQLALRLEKALAEYQRAPRTMVVCGSQGANEPATEASVMKAWLMSRGVPEEQVLMDEESFNTKENLGNAMALLPENTIEVTIVTSDYHLPRALRIAEDMGLKPTGVGSPIKPEYWLKNHAREAMAWGKYFLSKVVPLDGE